MSIWFLNKRLKMPKNSEISQTIEFYIDNDLNEVILKKAQNHFLQKDSVTEMVSDKKPCGMQNFIKPLFSTTQALSTLAQKLQSNNISDSNLRQEFLSLNEIINQAKKAADAAQSIAELQEAVKNFEGCNLKKMATNTVFCDGNPNAKVMVIGEAPGNNEDLQAIPFCGDSGKILDEMFLAINMTRKEDFYITNVIFWRPPGNRRPTDEELAICRPFVERHIQLFNPEILILVGATSMTAILGIHDAVTKIRGRFMDFAPKFLPKKTTTFTIFHPSYLMRQPAKKKIAWLDMLALEQFLKNK
jgi:DNA polymerase